MRDLNQSQRLCICLIKPVEFLLKYDYYIIYKITFLSILIELNIYQ